MRLQLRGMVANALLTFDQETCATRLISPRSSSLHSRGVSKNSMRLHQSCFRRGAILVPMHGSGSGGPYCHYPRVFFSTESLTPKYFFFSCHLTSLFQSERLRSRSRSAAQDGYFISANQQGALLFSVQGASQSGDGTSGTCSMLSALTYRVWSRPGAWRSDHTATWNLYICLCMSILLFVRRVQQQQQNSNRIVSVPTS